MAFLAIDGVPFSPTPSKCDVKTSDLHDNATRANAAGILVADLVRSNLRTLGVEWSHMTAAELAEFYRIWGNRMFHSITFFDPTVGRKSSGIFYRSDINAPVYRADDYGDVVDYINVKVTFVER